MTSAANEDGFTLLDMMVALGILALATLLLMPLARGPSRALTLESRALMLAADLRAVRTAAIKANMVTTLVIDTGTGGYASDSLSRPRALDRSITIAVNPADTTAIRFFPDGSSNGGAIALSQGRRAAVISIDWLTGAARVEWRR